MPAKKSKRSVGGRPIGSVNAAAWRRYQQSQDYNHGRSDVPAFEAIERFEISVGTGTLFDVPESNLDDGTRTPPPAQRPDTHPKSASRKPREIGFDALAG